MTDLGTDIATPVQAEGIPDLDPMFGLAAGRTALLQALARRLTTRRGLLAWIGDDPAYGEDVRDMLGDSGSTARASALAARVERQCLADERVLAAQATATFTDGALAVSVQATDAAGPFRFTLKTDGVTVALLGEF